MSYQVFARKYRPQTFDEVVGQEHITQTLKNAIEQRRLAQAYLFVGPRGVGKTSTARILAKALNCVNGPTTQPCGECVHCREIAAGTSLNVMEFDAASNTQVDKVRELVIENVKYAPASGTHKLYIIDEVHMLSNSSFNALLKTLEEPPPHVIFVFATTEVNKLPLTIISRCQRFDLRRIPAALIASHLQHIAGLEKITLESDAAATIARGAEGGLRDAESMLDQLVAFCGDIVKEDDVLSVFGFTAHETVAALCDHLIGGDTPGALAAVQAQADAGKDLSRLMADLISHLRNLLVAKADPAGMKSEVGDDSLAALADQAGRLAMDRLLDLIEQFAAAESRMKYAPNKKLHFEIAVIKAIQTLSQATLTEVIDTLTALRTGGEAPIRQAAPTPRPAPVVARKPSETLRAAEPKQTPSAPATAPESTAKGAEFPPAPAPPAAEPVSTEDLWPTLVREVARRRPLIRSWVEAGQGQGLTDDTLTIAFPPEQSLAMESVLRANNRKFIEEVLTSLTGRPTTIRGELREGIVVEPVIIAAVEAPPEIDPMEAFKNDPLIRKALEIFKGEIQPA